MGITTAVADGKVDETFTEKSYTDTMNTSAPHDIEYFVGLAEDIKKAGAGEKRMAAIQAKIQSLVPLTSANSAAEVQSIVNSASSSTAKVGAVLGSSAATVKDINKVLESTDLTEVQEIALKFKKKTLEGWQEVAAEKLMGSGTKPGIYQWLGVLSSGKATKSALIAVNDFIAGQDAKLKAFQDVVTKWDNTHKSPWTTGSTENAFGKPWDSNTKAAWRSAYASKTDGVNIKDTYRVDYGDKRNYSVLGAEKMVDIITKEATLMDGLRELSDKLTETSSESQEGTQEGKKEVKQPTSPEEDTKAPVEAESQDKTEEALRTKDATKEEIKLDKEELRKRNEEAAANAMAEDLAEEEIDVATELQEVSDKPSKPKEVLKRDSTNLANSGSGKYSMGVKEYMINYIRKTPAVLNKLKSLNIDLKDC